MTFQYVEAQSVGQAIDLLSTGGPDAHAIAGGTDLTLRIRRRQVTPRLVVGVGRLPELAAIEEVDGGLSVGACATLAAIARSPAVQRAASVLAEVCGLTRSPQVRTLATIGGTLCGASPLAEPAVALLALDARVQVRGPAGIRELALEAFALGPGRTVLEPGELLTRVLLPVPRPGTGMAYERLCRREAIEAPLAASAVSLMVGRDGVCRSARVVVGVATWPARLLEAEGALEGQRLEEDVLARAAEAAQGVEVREDVRAGPGYLRQMCGVAVARALRRAAAATQ